MLHTGNRHTIRVTRADLEGHTQVIFERSFTDYDKAHLAYMAASKEFDFKTHCISFIGPIDE